MANTPLVIKVVPPEKRHLTYSLGSVMTATEGTVRRNRRGPVFTTGR